MSSNWRQSRLILSQVFRHRLDLLIPVETIPRALPRWCLKTLHKILPTPATPRGQRLKQAFVELGPVYIKLGQLLSTRRDLLPADIADALADLQDKVPPIADFDVDSFVSTQLGEPCTSVFSDLQPTPLASASIAQVHCATLNSGEGVVVKLVRPGIEQVIIQDMALLKKLAGFINNRIPGARRLQLPRVMADHEDVLLQELTMFGEARNQIQLRRNFADSDLLYVPRVYPEHTREHLLVMERVYGIPINHVDELKARGVDLKVLAHKGVETFFKQVFEHNFFHADMHPGNILIETTDPENPKYIALDCAIIGSLTEADQNYLAQNLLAFFHKDYRRVVSLHLESGWVPADTDAQEFETVIRDVCEPIFAKPLAEISFAEFVITLLDTAGKFEMEVQPQLVLLQKTLLYIEGLGRQLYPELDLWETAQPFMERWATQHLGPVGVVNDWLNAGPAVWQQLSRLPMVMEKTETEIRLLKSQLKRQAADLEQMKRRNAQASRYRRFSRLAGVIVLLASLWWLGTPLQQSFAQGDGSLWAGAAGAFVGIILLLRT
ncbi:MAG: 2-polyprenylphenol 6-hydroxylase [Pseudomonadaceae bacterium]|nr:2-polyprenylphenol 6-hydroxylase [Pseudomonadaceae bacterium]